MRGPTIIRAHTSHVPSVLFAPDGQTLATAGMDNVVNLWAVPSWEPIRTFEGHEKGVCGVAFSPDGRWLALGAADKRVRVWEVK